ncbi:MAG: preprotein translocase subunit SecE [Chloroflexota bacterium]|nr:preprotein translocase subunit SecE [Chloroflexota bacterium]
MKVLRTRRPIAARTARVNLNRTVQDTRTELRKITWPTREETVRLTLVVIALSIVLAFFLGIVVDRAFFWLYSQLVGL